MTQNKSAMIQNKKQMLKTSHKQPKTKQQRIKTSHKRPKTKQQRIKTKRVWVITKRLYVNYSEKYRLHN